MIGAAKVIVVFFLIAIALYGMVVAAGVLVVWMLAGAIR